MKQLRVALFVAAVLLGAFLSGAVLGAERTQSKTPCGKDKSKEIFLNSIIHMEPPYSGAKGALLAKDASEWTKQEVTEYLKYAGIMVYYALMLQLIEDNWVHSTSPQQLADKGYLAEWPGNPFNGWKPMQIRDVTEGFFPGDIAREICPPEYASRGKRTSFQLYVFGADENWPQDQGNFQNMNTEWTTVPAGTAFTTGMHSETDAERQARIDRMKEVLERSK